MNRFKISEVYQFHGLRKEPNASQDQKNFKDGRSRLLARKDVQLTVGNVGW